MTVPPGWVARQRSEARAVRRLLTDAPLLVHLARRVQTEAEVELAAFGLRARHVIALTLLRDLGELNQSDLPATLGMDPTNVVALLNELEADDLVERRRSPQDRRRHTVLADARGQGPPQRDRRPSHRGRTTGP